METITVWIMLVWWVGGPSSMAVVDNIASQEECAKLADAISFPMKGKCFPVVKHKP